MRLSDRGRLHRTPHTTPAAPPLIELRDVSLTHDRTTLVDHLDLTVHENEHVALIGLTTTATTALAHLLTGRTTPTHGHVTTHTPAQHFTPHPHHTLAQALTGHPNPSPLDPHLPPTLAATGLDPRDLHTPLARLDHRLLTHIHHARTLYALRTGTRLFIHTTDPTPTRTPHTGHLLITPHPTHTRGADRILLLVQGRVTETGTHRQLLLRGGAYARLYALHRHTG
ncbi:ABC transporter ATP-binding protein [Nocardiopsis aegyptia]|uniref:Energy-coupling factor transporter ATP-binding protein EcfA2 n=1 Tax=Nocardiopsis aegyptia TaxID=220378 RepID=A0A7Z0EUI6_9ACTN|nr:ABC transporter ATP-binding protein [Nocardiopsis aegyptia]NYJ38076.1 energy-coupling factor transporter ATP-binding protein EcfA2 [Nocardiopsis aegyptia]